MPKATLIALGLLLVVVVAEFGLRRRALERSEDWGTRPLPALDTAATHIVVLGDSIAYGWGLEEVESWPSLLAERLAQTYPDRRWQVINASVSGAVVADAYVRFDQHVRKYRPQLVLIGFGVNDCRQVRRANDARRIALFARNETTWWGRSYLLRAIANRLRPLPAPDPSAAAQPATGPRIPPDAFRVIMTWMIKQCQRLRAQPVLLTISPLADDLDIERTYEFARWAEYNGLIRDLARRLETPVAEISHRLLGEQGWFPDGVHLTAQGQAVIAERVWHILHRPNLAPVLNLTPPTSNAEMAPALD
ncbi:MAG: hypothetical protein J5I90_03650 [Caldilineales bacterium]|nr:hypothetical protein [Caldilineales bacterium]